MNINLKPFLYRVRLLRGWRAFWVGLATSGVACLVLAGLDLSRIVQGQPHWFGAILAAGALLGLFCGLLLPVREADVVKSIDRRANLKDRLTTSREVEADSSFADELTQDTQSKLTTVKPAAIFPMRFGKFELASLLPSVIALAILGLSASQILIPEEKKKELKEVAAMGSEIERIAKPLTDLTQKADAKSDEKRLAMELERLQELMQRGRLDKPEALQQTGELKKDAEKLKVENAKETMASLEQAEDSLRAMEEDRLQQALKDVSPERARELASLSDKEREQAISENQNREDQVQAEISKLQEQIQEAETRLQNQNLTEAQRRQLESDLKTMQEQMEKLKAELAALQEAMQELMKSQEIQDLLKKMNDHPAMKEIQEMMQQLARDAQRAQEGEPQELTKEQIEQMKQRVQELQKDLEELAKELQDPQKMEEFMQALKESLENMGECQACNGLSIGLMQMLGIPVPMPSNALDRMGIDTGLVNKTEEGTPGAGKARPTAIRGQRQDGGKETFIEVRGPTTLGNKTSIPLRQVLPNARKKAENAIDRRKIPKQHEKRVKDYFDSLGQGGK
ncbi:MAG: hypothetical protein MUC92_07725 [Fimbriimonadaceae bacterium]|jgi:hypothetical protein|nr:hypothetical protein [Fimbriimonadaceae bacterium]